MRVTVHEAKAQLSKLIEAALAGEEVVIARDDTPCVRLVPIPPIRFAIGLLENNSLGEGPDFFAPLDESELRLWEGGDATWGDIEPGGKIAARIR